MKHARIEKLAERLEGKRQEVIDFFGAFDMAVYHWEKENTDKYDEPESEFHPWAVTGYYSTTITSTRSAGTMNCPYWIPYPTARWTGDIY